MTRGLVIGKFLPFHRGHRALIERAARRVYELDVIVCDAGWHMIPVQQRAAWIEEACAAMDVNARVITVDGDRYDVADDDSVGWAAITLELLGRAPDIVFTCEDYGDPYARALLHTRAGRARGRHLRNGGAGRASGASRLARSSGEGAFCPAGVCDRGGIHRQDHPR